MRFDEQFKTNVVFLEWYMNLNDHLDKRISKGIGKVIDPQRLYHMIL